MKKLVKLIEKAKLEKVDKEPGQFFSRHLLKQIPAVTRRLFYGEVFSGKGFF